MPRRAPTGPWCAGRGACPRRRSTRGCPVRAADPWREPSWLCDTMRTSKTSPRSAAIAHRRRAGSGIAAELATGVASRLRCGSSKVVVPPSPLFGRLIDILAEDGTSPHRDTAMAGWANESCRRCAPKRWRSRGRRSRRSPGFSLLTGVRVASWPMCSSARAIRWKSCSLADRRPRSRADPGSPAAQRSTSWSGHRCRAGDPAARANGARRRGRRRDRWHHGRRCSRAAAGRARLDSNVHGRVAALFDEGAAEVRRPQPDALCVAELERDPATQGFEEHSFDIVLAANVLHATRDLRETMRTSVACWRPAVCSCCSKAPTRNAGSI